MTRGIARAGDPVHRPRRRRGPALGRTLGAKSITTKGTVMTSIVVGTTDKETVRRLVVPTGIITFAVAALLSVTNADSGREAVVEVVVQAGVAALIFGLVVPRALKRES